ncbi:gephyrin-like molybdotransferase Glp [Catenovulum maritimum]|uniref:Molybdopterin molybdenumtransferase n=1 Tax=Catenovulum maritimum TaxID=1513271 RepID=A0A0J8GWJ1_9ALTE|nr:gephyrin-like molybdotransferase Glp [Catenovulum maritimum]KMT65664.1 molybdopterin molybdenumtransferase [Catenovulum maritimum]
MNCDCNTNGLMPLEQAKKLMLDNIQPVTETEVLGLESVNHRILAEDLHSTINVPPADNSAMDGYALHISELNETEFELVGIAYAGAPFDGVVKPGQCIRIMTGAVLPKGANSVVMQENVTVNSATVKIEVPTQLGENIRKAGSDIQRGQIILSKHKRLTPVDIGLIASVGLSKVSVFRKIKVGIFSTGDELVKPGNVLDSGQIYDSNRYMLKAMLEEMKLIVVDKGQIPDKAELIKQTFLELSQECDAIISSGGVSVGDADYTKDVIDEVGQVNFWKIAIKPGKPFAYGKIGNAEFFGLPGNPVSAVVTFEKIAKLGLEKLMAKSTQEKLELELPLIGNLRKKPGRTDFQRGKLISENGVLVGVASSGKQNSGVLSSLAQADCYIVLAQDDANASEGEVVKVQLK